MSAVTITVLLRIAAAVMFVAVGVDHLLRPAFFREIIPPGFPAPVVLVFVSGVAEIAGGIGLLIPPLRRLAAWGLLALLIAVFPANIYMAVSPQSIPGLRLPGWELWLRLPLQIVFVAWVWYTGLRTGGPVSSAK